jgi:hypothetical protein
MRLPAGRFHQLLSRNTAWPLEQVEDLGGLAAVAGGPRFLAPLGAFFAGVAFLADLVRLFATWTPRGARVAFLAAFGSSAAGAGAVPVSGVDVMMSPLAVITVMTWITPVNQESK